MEPYNFIEDLRDRVISGGSVSDSEAYTLTDLLPVASEFIREAAAKITDAFSDRTFDPCSIVNARSGLCGENCKWCAQSKFHSTGCETYDLVEHDTCMKAAALNDEQGIRRFSLVASGRAVKGKALEKICDFLREIKDTTGLHTCASLGLLDSQDLKRLWDSGVRRYHCNLETAPSHFIKLCTTHTIDDKIDTIKAAQKIGFEICSGGIIGMGETARQRTEFALKLREIKPASIPINILSPIPGTPLENEDPISEDDVLDTIAIFRFIHPTTRLRFAGGRSRLSRASQLEAMRIGINGAIVGDLLTTLGSTVNDDRQLVTEAGYKF